MSAFKKFDISDLPQRGTSFKTINQRIDQARMSKPKPKLKPKPKTMSNQNINEKTYYATDVNKMAYDIQTCIDTLEFSSGYLYDQTSDDLITILDNIKNTLLNKAINDNKNNSNKNDDIDDDLFDLDI